MPKPKRVAAEYALVSSPSPAPPDTLYPVSFRMQVPSHSGDSLYHLRMSETEIRSALDGTARWIRLPDRFDDPGTTRFLSMSNVMELSIGNLEWPIEDFIAEAQG